MKITFYKFHIFCIILALISFSCKKEGCTDIHAINYNSNARSNPELCIYAVNDTSGYSDEDLPILMSGSLNFIDDSLLIAYQGVTDYLNSDETIIPDVFGSCPPNGFSFIIRTAQFEDKECQFRFLFFVENQFSTPLYGDYEVPYGNPYIGYSIYVMGKLNDEDDFNATFPTSNYLNYYKDLNNPITNMEGNISINFREPEPDEKYTDFSGSIEATIYYDEEIVLNQNNQEVRIYHKKLLVNMSCDGKVEVY